MYYPAGLAGCTRLGPPEIGWIRPYVSSDQGVTKTDRPTIPARITRRAMVTTTVALLLRFTNRGHVKSSADSKAVTMARNSLLCLTGC